MRSAVFVSMVLPRFFTMMGSMERVAMRHMSVVSSRGMIAGLVMPGGLAMMFGGVFVMLGGFVMMLSAFVSHVRGSPFDLGTGEIDYRERLSRRYESRAGARLFVWSDDLAARGRSPYGRGSGGGSNRVLETAHGTATVRERPV